MDEIITALINNYGLPGVVVSACFYGLYILVKQGRDERKEMMQQASEERREWREVFENVSHETNTVIRELATVIEKKTK